MKQISKMQTSVLNLLQQSMGDDGVCCTSAKEIAAELGVATTTVRDAIRCLVEDDIVKRVRRPEGYIYRMARNA